jgi:peptide/nickel transport system substrate-binding protein
VRILRDLNAVVANVLAGDVDVVPNFVLDPEAVVEMRRRWAGTTNQAMVTVDTTGFQILEVQHRPEYAQPAFGLATLEVRQALNGAIDRVTLADVMTGGLAPPADSWIAPTTHRRSQVESAIPQYPYDLTRSRQLLAAAGWRPGDGGTLAHERTGQPFTLQISARGDVSDERLGSIIADQWKALGVQATLQPIPPALASDRQVLSTHPGVLIASGNAEFLQTDRLHSKNVTAEANRWNGSNRGGYSNPRVDALYDRLAITIEPGARLELTRQLLSETMSDVALMPLYWSTKVWLAVADVRGIKDGGTWNAFEWDRG